MKKIFNCTQCDRANSIDEQQIGRFECYYCNQAYIINSNREIYHEIPQTKINKTASHQSHQKNEKEYAGNEFSIDRGDFKTNLKYSILILLGVVTILAGMIFYENIFEAFSPSINKPLSEESISSSDNITIEEYGSAALKIVSTNCSHSKDCGSIVGKPITIVEMKDSVYLEIAGEGLKWPRISYDTYGYDTTRNENNHSYIFKFRAIISKSSNKITSLNHLVNVTYDNGVTEVRSFIAR